MEEQLCLVATTSSSTTTISHGTLTEGLYYIVDWSSNLYTADPNSYNAIQVSGLGGDPYDGLIYVNAVPEPGTIMLLGSGVIGLATKLRKKK